MFVSPKHSQFQKKGKPKHLRSCSLISIQFLPLSCNARFPQSDLKIIASSDSLEVQACRPIKTQ